MAPSTRVLHALYLLPRFFREVLSRFQEDRCFQIASSLTFTTLLALVPLVTVSLVLVSVFPMFSGLTSQVDDFIAAHVLPEQIGKVIKSYFDQFSIRSGRLTAIGMLFLVGAGIINMMTIERAFNTIWRVPHPKPTARRVLVFWAVLTMGPILIGASLTMTSYLVSVSLGLAKGIPLIGGFSLGVLPVALAVMAFTLLYILVPARPVRRPHALIGGLVAGLLFEIAKRAFALYVARSPGYTLVYGAFATIPVFLMWVYLSWVVTTLGAVVVATLPDYWLLSARRARPPGTDYRDALDVLVAVAGSRRGGEILDGYRIAAEVRLPLARCENLLESLEQAGWVGQLGRDRWILVRDPSALKLSEVYRRFALSPEALMEGRAESPVTASFTALDKGIDDLLDISLQNLLLPVRGPGNSDTR